MKDQSVPFGKIVKGENIRKVKDDDSLAELAASIRAHGLIAPLVVREETGKFRVIAGHRRYAALKKNATEASTPISCKVLTATEELDDEIRLAENIIRLPLNPLEEADAFAALAAKPEATLEGIADHYGTSTKRVRQRLQLARLQKPLRAVMDKGKLTLAQAARLATLDDETQETAATRIRQQHGVAPDFLVDHILSEVRIPVSRALFDVKATGLVVADDLFSETEPWVTDRKRFFELQRESLKEQVEELSRETAWARVELIDAAAGEVRPGQRVSEEEALKDGPSHVLAMVLHPDGGVERQHFVLGSGMEGAQEGPGEAQEKPRADRGPVSKGLAEARARVSQVVCGGILPENPELALAASVWALLRYGVPGSAKVDLDGGSLLNSHPSRAGFKWRMHADRLAEAVTGRVGAKGSEVITNPAVLNEMVDVDVIGRLANRSPDQLQAFLGVALALAMAPVERPELADAIRTLDGTETSQLYIHNGSDLKRLSPEQLDRGLGYLKETAHRRRDRPGTIAAVIDESKRRLGRGEGAIVHPFFLRPEEAPDYVLGAEEEKKQGELQAA